MDRNSVIGLVLIFVLMAGYAYWRSPSAEEKAAKQEQMAKQAQENKTVEAVETTQAPVLPKPNSEEADSTKANKDIMNPFVLATEGKEESFVLENEVFKVHFQNKGGRIQRIELKDYKDSDKNFIKLLDAEHGNFALSFFANNRAISTKDLYFEYDIPQNKEVSGKDSLVLTMRAYANNPNLEKLSDQYIEYVYTLRAGEYMIGFDIRFKGLDKVIAVNANFLDLHWNQRLRQYEKGLQMESTNTAVYYKPMTDKVDYLNETGDDQESITTPLKWVSFKQQFFCVSLIAKNELTNAEISNHTDKKEVDAKNGYLKDLNAVIGIPYQANPDYEIPLQIYAGPNKFRILKDYHLDLERQIPLGWSFFLMQWINRFAVIPTFDLLEKWNINYGIIILILTILLKLLLFPVTYKSYLSSAKMRVLKPEVDELSKKFPKPEQALEKQKATMSLYKKAGASPMSGCIPMLVQFPILIAMFRFFPASIELRHESFLWADDLSSYDSIINLPFTIPFYGAHVSLFALLMAISNLLYTRMTMKQQAANPQMAAMKYMMYFMPIMFLGLLNSYSAALNYYYFLSTIITFFQMWLIRKFVDDDKIHARIQENKKKPVVKSKFQARLEEMARRQQEMQRNQQNRR